MTKPQKIRIGLLGAQGRMGSAIIKELLSNPHSSFVLTAAICRPGSQSQGKDIGMLLGEPKLGVSLTPLRQWQENKADGGGDLGEGGGVDVWIDFSSHDALDETLPQLIKMGKPVVNGVTNYSSSQKEQIQAAAKCIPYVYSPNMSIGINLMLAFLEKTARSFEQAFPESLSIHITDAHHRYKKDAPSGTAHLLADRIHQNLKGSSTRDQSPIEIHSLRQGLVVADHDVTFSSDHEQLTLKHHCLSRQSMAQGALTAAAWIINQPPGLYNMEHVLDFKAGEPHK